MFYIHKGTVNKSVKGLTEEEINNYLNQGWEPGKCPSHWIHNGDDSLLLKEGLPLPEGYVYGQSEKQKLNTSLSGKKRWKEASEEDKSRWSKASSTASKRVWDSLALEAREIREEHRQTTRANWTEEEDKQCRKNMSDAAKRNRKTITPDEYKKRADRGFQTRRAHKTTNTSRAEEDLYQFLTAVFGEDGICREYKEIRYPFHCDFYIKSEDLFIELNLHWSHGNHPFTESSEEDQRELARIRSKQGYLANGEKNGYFVHEEVWTRRDVEKYNIATSNNLRYITLYTKREIEEFKKRLSDEITKR